MGLLYEDGAYAREVQPGKLKLKQGFLGGMFDRVARTVTLVDLRERLLTLKGQEILTADKVAIRVSLLVYFKITDAAAAVHNVASYEERIDEDVQLNALGEMAKAGGKLVIGMKGDALSAMTKE